MRKIIFVIALMLPIALTAQNSTCFLKGKIGDIHAPSKIYLFYKNVSGYQTDSVVLQHGQFEFKGIVEEPVRASLSISYSGHDALNDARLQTFALYLEPGIIHLSSPDSLINAKITGSKTNAAFEKLNEALKPTDRKKAAMMEDYYARQRSGALPDTGFMRGFNSRYNDLSDQQAQIRFQFVKDHPASFVSLDALKSAGGASPDYYVVAPLFDSFSPDIRKTLSGRLYAKDLEVMKVSSVGMIAPDFIQNTPDDKPVRLSDFKGRYVLIDFWASWCGPCRAENPDIVRAYHVYHGKGLEIIGVSLDDLSTKSAWIKAIQQDNLMWYHVSDLKGWENKVAKQYRIQSVPANFLLDKTGKIIARNLKGEVLDKKLKEIFE